MGFFSKQYSPPQFDLERRFIAMSDKQFADVSNRQFEQWFALHLKVKEGGASSAEKDAVKSAEEWKQIIEFASSFRFFLMEAGWVPPREE
jgi:hypothetical protein